MFYLLDSNLIYQHKTQNYNKLPDPSECLSLTLSTDNACIMSLNVSKLGNDFSFTLYKEEKEKELSENGLYSSSRSQD